MTYKCSACKQVFKEAWSDEEALKESKEKFGEISKENLYIVCDDCFKEMGF